jgi:hypothetical protein
MSKGMYCLDSRVMISESSFSEEKAKETRLMITAWPAMDEMTTLSRRSRLFQNSDSFCAAFSGLSQSEGIQTILPTDSSAVPRLVDERRTTLAHPLPRSSPQEGDFFAKGLLSFTASL